LAKALETAYLNGKYLPINEAAISPLDRGFLFGDAVYEVIPFYNDQALLMDAHLSRLERSLQEVSIASPHSMSEWKTVISTLVNRNGGGNLTVYLQVSRGADSGRDQVFPAAIPPTVFAMVTRLKSSDYRTGVSAITLPDDRWGR
jgi:D-alanine transaminase